MSQKQSGKSCKKEVFTGIKARTEKCQLLLVTLNSLEFLELLWSQKEKGSQT